MYFKTLTKHDKGGTVTNGNTLTFKRSNGTTFTVGVKDPRIDYYKDNFEVVKGKDGKPIPNPGATSTSQGRNNFAQTIQSGFEYVPGVGDVLDATKVGIDVKDGNYSSAAIGAGLLLLPNFIEKPLKTIGRIGKKYLKQNITFNKKDSQFTKDRIFEKNNIVNYQGDHVDLLDSRLNNGGYDKLIKNEAEIGFDATKKLTSSSDPEEILEAIHKNRKDTWDYNNFSEGAIHAFNNFKPTYITSTNRLDITKSLGIKNYNEKKWGLNSEGVSKAWDLLTRKRNTDQVSEFFKKRPAFSIGTKGVFIDPENLANYHKKIGDNKNRFIESHEKVHQMYFPTEHAEGFNNINLSALRHSKRPHKELVVGSLRRYFKNSTNTELSARGSQLKNYFGFDKANQELTTDHLRYAKKYYTKDTGTNNNMSQFFDSISNYEKAAKWLNKHAPVVVPTLGVTTQALNKNNEDNK